MAYHNHSHNSNDNAEALTTEQLISLISVYEAELDYRDNILYSRMFTLSYISLLIMLLPYWGEFFVSSLPRWLIITVGIVNEILTLIISIIHGNRLDCTSTTYRKLLEKLPADCQKATIEYTLANKDKRTKEKFLQRLNEKTFNQRVNFYKLSLAYLSPTLLCSGVIIIGLVLLCYF